MVGGGGRVVGRVVIGVVIGVVITGSFVVFGGVVIGGCVENVVGVGLLVGLGVAAFSESTSSSSLNASSFVLIVLSGGRTM